MPILESLAVFPLSDVVLLPEVSVPLYIFEPRYRQMTRDALEGDHQIGMVTVRPDGLANMAGDPPIFDIGCLGRIAHAQERPDGTFNIMLLGEQRFRILEESKSEADRLYRTARVELLEDQIPSTPDDHEALGRARETLLSLVDQLIRRIGKSEDPGRATAAFAGLDETRLVNALAQSIRFEPIERQQLLEAPSIVGRFETMADLLRFRLADTDLGDADPSRLPN